MGRLRLWSRKSPGQLLDEALKKSGGRYDEIRDTWSDLSGFSNRVWRKSNFWLRAMFVLAPVFLSWLLAIGLVTFFRHLMVWTKAL